MIIYFAIKENQEDVQTFAATSLQDVSGFVGCHAESLRRAFRTSNKDFIECKGCKVYRSELNRISGRGGFMAQNYRQ